LSESPFSNREFRRLYLAQIGSLAGSGLATVALALLAYDIAGGNAGLVLGTALAIKMIAYVTIAPIAGAYASRVPRRGFLISLDLIRSVIVCLLPFATEVLEVYVLIFLLNACAAAFTPTYQSTIPEILTDDARYTRALSYSRLAYDIESLASPTIAALALAFMSYHILFAVNGITFLISAALIFTTRLPNSNRITANLSIWGNITEGTRLYWATPRLRGLLALSFAMACGGALVIVDTVVLVRDVLGGTDVDMAIVLACYGAGSMLAAILLPRWLDHHPDRAPMMLGGIMISIALACGTFATQYFAVFVIWFALGVGGSLIQTPAGRLLKRSSTEDNRPAIYAAQFSMSHACWLFAYPAAGWIGSMAGLTATFVILSLLSLVAVCLTQVIWRLESS
jgi:MFS family permease